MELTTTLILVVLFLMIEAFFSGCEIGLIAINRIKLEQKAQEGHAPSQSVLDVLKEPEKLFTTTSIGTNVAVVSSTAIFTAFMVGMFGHSGDIIAALIISPIILFLGEIVPKIVFQAKADSLMPALIGPLNWSSKVLGPVIEFFSRIYLFIMTFLVGPNPPEAKSVFSREQIMHVIHPESEHADLGIDEKKMIHRIFNLSDTTVEQCMVPLVQMYALSDTATLEDANNMANETGHSRLPVFHERMFNMIGIINTFDLLTLPSDSTPVTQLVRPAYYVPPSKKVDDLLKELQQRGLHIAIVVDEYGGCIGIVTVEDLLEEIVGDIEDEYDEVEELFEKYPGGGYLVAGEMEIDSINEKLDWKIPEGDYETIGGLIIEHLEKIPVAGDQIVTENHRITVKEAGKRKINTVIIKKLSPEDNEDSTEESTDKEENPPPPSPAE